ncbi:MAG: response regulator [Planctomycetes bacterium]|nr:response regulator [Planctomycetota bacterium]
MQRVLLIDRDVEFIAGARTLLEQHGFEVEIALHGGTGVDIVTNRRVDLVLLCLEDLEAPGTDLLQRIKEAKPGITLLAVGRPATHDRVVGDLKERIAGFLDKPLDPTAFLREIDRALAACVC